MKRGGVGRGEKKLQEENKEAASKKRKTRARDRSVKEKGREGQGIKKKKNQLFLGTSRQHTQSARVTLTADAILTF